MPSILNPNQNQTITSYAKWTNIYAIINIVFGVLTLLSIVGAFQIWAALKLREAAKLAKQIAGNGNLQGYEALNQLTEVLEKQAFYTKVLTIILIVQLVAAILVPVLFIGTIIAAITGGGADVTSLIM